EHAHYFLSNSRQYILTNMHERYEEPSYFSRDMIKKFLLKNVSPLLIHIILKCVDINCKKPEEEKLGGQRGQL
ncbi:MAG: hypothetical protein ACE5J2_08955, partial [Nitrososphaerales archaeon]